jgi:hypothetical protein
VFARAWLVRVIAVGVLVLSSGVMGGWKWEGVSF